MKWFLALLVISSTIVFAQNNGAATQDLSTLHGVAEPPMLGIHWARGFNPFSRNAPKGKPVNMTYHGGVILTSVSAQAIFWGPSWTNSKTASS